MGDLRSHCYELKLTDDEVKALHWVGTRYAWAPPLLECCHNNVVRFTECEMWQWSCDVLFDNHEECTFPLASPQFAIKLHTFMDTLI